MDTIDLSNLNRQFLFREADIGKSKAEVAANFVNKRVKGINVIPHNCKIQDKDTSFYRRFHIIICGLDSIPARKWLNAAIVSSSFEMIVNFQAFSALLFDLIMMRLLWNL